MHVCRMAVKSPLLCLVQGDGDVYVSRMVAKPPLSCLVQGVGDADEEVTSLGAQNEALKVALEDSRRDLQAMAAQVIS